jgi:mono/diheme cytochrome c family protein
VLGVSARQLDRIGAWNRHGLFEPAFSDAEVARLPRLARPDDPTRSLEDRARSYLDVNCAQCHRPGGVPADFDARFTTPLAEQRLVGAPVRINLGVDNARAVAPNDPWRSAVLTRMTTSDPTRMPPLAHESIDRDGVELVRAWIASLPGPPVLSPPTIRPGGGDYREPVCVTLEHPDRSATIRYTLDGSAPGKDAPSYARPFEVRGSTTVRARAFRPGWTRSVVVQETLIFGG